MRSLPLSIQTLPLRPVTRGAVVRMAAAVLATFTLSVIGGKLAPGASTSVRVQVVLAQVQPGPLAEISVSPAGSGWVTVVTEPSVGPLVGLETVSVIWPVAPRTNTLGLCVAAIFSGCGTSAHGAGGEAG